MPNSIESPIRYERLKKSVVLDRKIFKICEVKEKEFGRLSKKSLFIHYDGKKWDILIANPDFSKIRYFQLK